eukprot:Nk52_evm10s2474 gene=Nk52_evmTU10s2474
MEFHFIMGLGGAGFVKEVTDKVPHYKRGTDGVWKKNTCEALGSLQNYFILSSKIKSIYTKLTSAWIAALGFLLLAYSGACITGAIDLNRNTPPGCLQNRYVYELEEDLSFYDPSSLTNDYHYTDLLTPEHFTFGMQGNITVQGIFPNGTLPARNSSMGIAYLVDVYANETIQKPLVEYRDFPESKDKKYSVIGEIGLYTHYSNSTVYGNQEVYMKNMGHSRMSIFGDYIASRADVEYTVKLVSPFQPRLYSSYSLSPFGNDDHSFIEVQFVEHTILSKTAVKNVRLDQVREIELDVVIAENIDILGNGYDSTNVNGIVLFDPLMTTKGPVFTMDSFYNLLKKDPIVNLTFVSTFTSSWTPGDCALGSFSVLVDSCAKQMTVNGTYIPCVNGTMVYNSRSSYTGQYNPNEFTVHLQNTWEGYGIINFDLKCAQEMDFPRSTDELNALFASGMVSEVPVGWNKDLPEVPDIFEGCASQPKLQAIQKEDTKTVEPTSTASTLERSPFLLAASLLISVVYLA